MSELIIRESRVGKSGKVGLLALEGTIAHRNLQSFADAMQKVAGDGIIHMVLDFDKAVHISSAGLGLMVYWGDTLREKKGAVALIRMHPNIQSIFEILGLEASFIMSKNLQGALEALGEMP